MIQFYQFLHVASAFLLVGITFKVFAKPDPATRKTNLMLAGIFALAMLVGGFGLQARLPYGWDNWLLVKVGCWVVLSGLAGMAYRKPQSTGALVWICRIVVLLAVFMVYYKPF
jgi:hypothetical protein